MTPRRGAAALLGVAAALGASVWVRTLAPPTQPAGCADFSAALFTLGDDPSDPQRAADAVAHMRAGRAEPTTAHHRLVADGLLDWEGALAGGDVEGQQAALRQLRSTCATYTTTEAPR